LRQKESKTYLGDTCKLTANEATGLLEQAEEVGFVDFEELGGDKVYFNGNLFRREHIAKTQLVLSSLTPEEQRRVTNVEALLKQSGFGKEQDVLILDGSFLDRLEKSPGGEPFENRLSEEQFVELLGTYRPSKEGGDWKGRYKGAKRPLARDLGYNAINGWLIDAKFFGERLPSCRSHRVAPAVQCVCSWARTE
jgi:hypothetical protein